MTKKHRQGGSSCSLAGYAIPISTRAERPKEKCRRPSAEQRKSVLTLEKYTVFLFFLRKDGFFSAFAPARYLALPARPPRAATGETGIHGMRSAVKALQNFLSRKSG